MADRDRTAEAAAAAWGLPPPALLRAGMNDIYVAGDVVLRVGTAAASVELARALLSAGLRVPAPVHDEPFVDDGVLVTAWRRLLPVAAEPDWTEVGRMVALVHRLGPDIVPASVSLPPCESFPWWHFDQRLAEVDDLLDDAARAGGLEVVERHAHWAEGVERVVCHGDVHPGNVMATAEGTVLLDWDLLCSGPPGWDHAMLLRLPRWGWPTGWYDEFTAGYGRSLAGEPATEAIADLRLVAATLMRLRVGAAGDPAAAGEAQRRLAFWRGDPNAPTWTTQ